MKTFLSQIKKSFFLILFFTNFVSYPQKYEIGIPNITSFTPKDYGYESQNYSVAQDTNKIIYIGNLNGILIFDGYYWENVKINGIPKLAFSAYNNKIFVGGYKCFGYLKNEYYNHYEFVNVIDSAVNIGQVEYVKVFDKYVFFSDKYTLYKYNIETGKVSLVKSADLLINLFVCDTLLYVTDYRKLFAYNPVSDKLKFITDNFDDYIYDIFSYADDTLMIKTEWNFYYLFPENNKTLGVLSKNVIALNRFFKKNTYLETIKLTNDVFASGSATCGLIFFDKNFDILFVLNEDNGLSSNEITDLFVDKCNNLWVSTAYGVNHIEYPSDFTFYNYALGAKSFVRDMIRYNGTIYLATRNGLYYIDKTKEYHKGCFSSEIVKPVFEDVDFGLTNFFKVNHKLYISSDYGLYTFDGQSFELAQHGLYSNIYRLRKDTSIVLIARLNGVEKFKITDDDIVPEGRFMFLNNNIRTIAEDDESIWFGSDYEGLFRIMFTDSLKNESKVYEYTKAKGLPENFSWIDVYTTSNGVLFSTEKGVLRYDHFKGRFVFDTTLGINFASKKYWVYPVVEDKNKNIWFSMGITGKYEKHTFVARYNPQTKKYRLERSQFYKISNYTIEKIYPESDQLVWFSAPKGIIRYEKTFDRFVQKPYFPILIHKLIIGKDSLYRLPINYLAGNSEKIILDYDYHDIHIEVVVPDFNKNDKVYYQFFLKGYEKKPSEWKTENVKEYTNLPQGDYSLIVRAKNSNDIILGEIVIPFEVKAPFYLTPFAFIYYAILLISLIYMVLYWRAYLSERDQLQTQILLKERTKQLAYQKERVEQLLKKILPDETTKQIKEKGKVERKSYKMVTVLFADIKGFTQIAENTPPEALLDELDTLYLQFDELVEEMGIEKIKTIGDAYMCAGGIPKKNRTNPIEVVLVGLNMLQVLDDVNKTSKTRWQMRIGIHTGPVIAGILGTKRFTYDIWGDTVNVASRMESLGEPGKVNISHDTYELVERFFECVPRGEIPVKYKGKLKMYFVKGIKPELSENGEGKVPNKDFWLKLQMVRFFDLEEYMLDRLEKELPDDLYYHNLRHTLDVMNQVELIAREEGCTEEEVLLLKTAALFHDAGFIKTRNYVDHEEQGIKLAKEILPKFKYTPEQINRIAQLIYATKLPPNPKDKLEQIMCDADLDYLGREDFLPVSDLLYKELSERHLVTNKIEWDKKQIAFLENHQYFTETARKNRRVNKLKQLEKLKKQMEEYEKKAKDKKD